ncbi:MAG: 1-deoxy-D-xylulose-5-phosphate synthase N-terminal domain-containing protein [Candidatus Shapirobacteria bacterium]|jgi:transketolase
MFLPWRQHPLHSVSRSLRLDLLEMINRAPGGHIGGSLSALDPILSVYESGLFDFKLNDKFILSAGHLAPALYVVLSHEGYFPKDYLYSYASFSSFLQGHVSSETPGVFYSSGSLGQGLSYSAGLALGDSGAKIVCLTTDGEQEEGQIWEAAAFAATYKLGNLINIIDHNKYQLGGATKDIQSVGNLATRYLDLGWQVLEINGHSFSSLQKALKTATNSSDVPTCLVCHTTFASGVSFMENNYKFHDVKSLTPIQYRRARGDLMIY